MHIPKTKKQLNIQIPQAHRFFSLEPFLALRGIDLGNSVEASREIEGGKENISTNLPLIIGGQKGLVEESDLRIPNMRGIMMARKKELVVVETSEDPSVTNSKSFEKPQPKGDVTLVSPDDIEKLIELLHNEAKAL